MKKMAPEDRVMNELVECLNRKKCRQLNWSGFEARVELLPAV